MPTHPTSERWTLPYPGPSCGIHHFVFLQVHLLRPVVQQLYTVESRCKMMAVSVLKIVARMGMSILVMAMVVGSAPATRSYRNAMVPPQRHERHCKPSRCSRRHVEQRILGGGGGGSGGGASSSSSLWLSLNGTQSSVYVVLNVLMSVCMCASVSGCGLCVLTQMSGMTLLENKQTNERNATKRAS